MTKKKADTYRMNERTGEWEKVPKREPIIADWQAAVVFLSVTLAAFGLSVVFRLFMWA